MDPKDFHDVLLKHGFKFFTGVPDSIFKSWMNFLEEEGGDFTDIRAVNECEAVAISAGYHLSTGDYGVVYTQSDGFAKCINPITSLTDNEVYGIPMLMIIGWRGEPGINDADQHQKIGGILLRLLDLLEIQYEILPPDPEKVDAVLKHARKRMEGNGRSFALIIRKGIFEGIKSTSEENPQINREEALKIVINSLSGQEVLVSTTGKLSRELFELRERRGENHENDFYNVGAMGCAQSIGLGIAMQREQKVVILDGDGSALMQMGALATQGRYAPDNFYHIIFDNRAHGSTGGQKTSSSTVEFDKVALACNYKSAKNVENKNGIKKAVRDMIRGKGPALLVLKVGKGARKDLGRPDIPLKTLKGRFMNYLKTQNP